MAVIIVQVFDMGGSGGVGRAPSAEFALHPNIQHEFAALNLTQNKKNRGVVGVWLIGYGNRCTFTGMAKKVNKARPWSYRVPVHLEQRLEAIADVSGLSVGKWTEALVVARLQEGEWEAFTDTPADWMDRQLPPGDRQGAEDATQNSAFSDATHNSEVMQHIIGADATHMQHITGYDATHDHEIETGRTDGHDSVAEDDGEGSEGLPGAGDGQGVVDGGVPGLLDAAISGEERSDPNGRIPSASVDGGHGDDLPGNRRGAPQERPISRDERIAALSGLQPQIHERGVAGSVDGITPEQARQARIDALRSELT